MGLIDFHTHAFPDDLARNAIPLLEAEAGVKAVLDGTLSNLIASMQRSGVCVSVVSSIATKPSHFASIFSWSRSIASSSIVPFPSVHPDDPDVLEKITQISEAGFKGLKLHPYYQGFLIDEPRMRPLFERISEENLILLCHTGFDIAFERKRVADPERVRRLIDDFPRLLLVASHFGAWDDWDEVERHLLGRDIYMDISYSQGFIGVEQARRILEGHPREYLLFGTDSPWGGQEATIDFLRSMDLGVEKTEAILFGNAARLLEVESNVL